MLFYQIILYKINFSAAIIQYLELIYFAYREYYFQLNSNIKSLSFYILPQLQLGEVYNQGFSFLDYQYSYRPTCFSNRICLQSFPLTSQSVPIKMPDGYQINPRSLSCYLRSLTLTILKFSLRIASLKFRSTLYYYQSTYTSSYPPASYQKRSSSLLYLWYLGPLV